MCCCCSNKHQKKGRESSNWFFLVRHVKNSLHSCKLHKPMLKLLRNIVPICVIAAFLCVPTSLFGQLSKVHYIPPISITSYINNSLPEDQFIYISTPSINDITYVIKPVGVGATDYIYGKISNKSPVIFDVRQQSSIPMFSTQIVIPESLGCLLYTSPSPRD